MAPIKIENIIAFFSKVASINFDGAQYFVGSEEKNTVEEYGISYEEFGDQLKLKIKSLFPEQNVRYLEALESEIKSSDLQSSILVVSKEGALFTYSPDSNVCTTNGTGSDAEYTRFQNLIAYYRLFNQFRIAPFCDYFNSANSELVFYNSANGIIKIKYDVIPVIVTKSNLTPTSNRLIELAQSIEVSPFLKNSFYTISKGTGLLKFTEIIAQGEEIVSITKRDYELASKKFDFENFRKSLYKEKEKYFTGIREIISKIFSQAIGIPISISASVFATYKVSDNSFMLILVLLAYALYVAFYIKVQTVYRADLLEVEKDFLQSFSIISDESGIPPETIDVEKQKVQRKINSTKDIIFWSIWLVAFLSLLVVVYIVYEIFFNETSSFVKFLMK